MDALVLFVLLSAAVLVAAVARRLGWPAPLLVVALAIAVSLLPGLPDFSIDSELTLTVVLPPLLYSAALEVSIVSFQQVRNSIWRLGVWLVLVSAVVVGAVIFVLVPDMTWPVALLIGAIVAPPDAVSAVAIGRRVGLPRRVMTILTGESLVNDASSLTIFKVALAIVGGASLSLSDDLWIFVAAVVVGVLVGAVSGLVFLLLRRLFRDPPIQILLGLMLPFFVYVGAEHFSGSGVLAVVTAGLIVGFNSSKSDYQLRLQEQPVWNALNLLLESFVFALIGLQFHTVLDNIVNGDRGLAWSIGVAALTVLTCIAVRFGFVFISSSVGNLRARRREQSQPGREDKDMSPRSLRDQREQRQNARRRNRRTGEVVLSWQEMFVISWSGMRGVVTLAAAVSVPAVMASGLQVPAHDLIVFIAFVVTVSTLLMQGLTLPLVARWLDVIDHEREDRDHEAKARFLYESLDEAALSIVEDAKRDPEKYPGAGVAVVAAIQARIRNSEGNDLPTSVGSEAQDGLPAGQLSQGGFDASREAVTRIRREVLARRRNILTRERNAGTIDEELVKEILLVFDADELLLDNRGY